MTSCPAPFYGAHTPRLLCYGPVSTSTNEPTISMHGPWVFLHTNVSIIALTQQPQSWCRVVVTILSAWLRLLPHYAFCETAGQLGIVLDDSVVSAGISHMLTLGSGNSPIVTVSNKEPPFLYTYCSPSTPGSSMLSLQLTLGITTTAIAITTATTTTTSFPFLQAGALVPQP